MFNNLPAWLIPHLFSNKKFSEFSSLELNELKTKLAAFQSTAPEISVVIPAYNEENNIYRTLSSLANNATSYPVEIIVINNNSKDRTQEVLDKLGVKSYFQPLQGIAYARQMGLEHAKGKYHLCADADTFYPPDWINVMVKPMMNNKEVVGVYGRYSFMSMNSKELWLLKIYEKITGILFRLRKNRKEFMNVLGFNMGFVTHIGREKNGFEVKAVRKLDNSRSSDSHTEISEDGTMALHLLTVGKLQMVTDPRARVFTSTRKIAQDGGVVKAFQLRIVKHATSLVQSFTTSNKKLFEKDVESVTKAKE